jgi:peptide/nickel transport system permease protein
VAFLVRRLLLTVPILFIVSVLCFSMINLIPGDPATVILGPEATEQAKEQMRNRLNLNDPIPVQYLDWLGGVLRGDLGESLIDDEPVANIILQRPARHDRARHRDLPGEPLDSRGRRHPLGEPAGDVGRLPEHGRGARRISIPHFWLGMMFIIIFAVNLGWLPASGYVPFFENPVANLTAMILPIFATGLRESAELTRMLRSSLLEELGPTT